MRLATPTFLVLSCLFCTHVFSQSVTIDISGGYCLPIAQSTEALVNYRVQVSTPPHTYTTYAKLKRVSYAQGGCVALNFNWYSKKNIGFGLKLNAQIGSAFKNKTVLIAPSTGTEYYDFTDKAFSFQFIPHLCFKHDFKKVSPVLEAGMVVGLTEINHTYTATSSFYSETINSRVRDNGGVMLGFYSSLGVMFHVSKVVKINLAVNCIAASYSPTDWQRKSFHVNGIDRMNLLNTSQRQGQYVKELDLQASPNPGDPDKSLKYSAAMSSVGLTAGICFSIGRQNKKPVKKTELNLPPPTEKDF